MIWQTIQKLKNCERVKLPDGYSPNLLVIRIPADGTSWLIGPYKELTRVATALRGDERLWPLLTEKKVRLGRRATDVPPFGKEQRKSMGETQLVQSPGSFAGDRKPGQQNTFLKPNENRRSDREENVRLYWESKTLESHHIVEYNNLAKLRLSTRKGAREIDYNQLPAVMLAAEFHRAYLNLFFQPARQFARRGERAALAGQYSKVYQSSDLFFPLYEISQIVLRAASLS